MIAAGFAGALLVLRLPVGFAQERSQAVDEVYDLIRTNLTGFSPAEIERTAVTGLVAVFGPHVQLVYPSTAGEDIAAVLKTQVYDGEIGYVRVGRVTEDFADSLRKAYEGLTRSNKLSGLVLDLRYVNRGDYAAAVAAADLFLHEERPLLDWGNGFVKSKANEAAIRVPATVLINGQTAGAAEALAAMIRMTGTGLLLGTKTSGQAVITREFKLTSGGTLAIATAPVKLGDGSPMPIHGVSPDIAVALPAKAQAAWYADPFAALSSITGARLTGTNAVRRTRFGEAELVKGKREGFPTDAELISAPAASDPEKPVIRDPMLARALDVLKGLALVRQGRS